MKIDKKVTNKPIYYCDRCGKEISYANKTLNKIYVEKEYNKKYKVCDLCDRCFRSLEKRNNT